MPCRWSVGACRCQQHFHRLRRQFPCGTVRGFHAPDLGRLRLHAGCLFRRECLKRVRRVGRNPVMQLIDGDRLPVIVLQVGFPQVRRALLQGTVIRRDDPTALRVIAHRVRLDLWQPRALSNGPQCVPHHLVRNGLIGEQPDVPALPAA